MGALLARPVSVVDVEALVVRLYLETGDDMTVKEIALALGCAESTVRRKVKLLECGLQRNQRFLDGRWVSVYGPSRAILRELVLQYNQVS